MGKIMLIELIEKTVQNIVEEDILAVFLLGSAFRGDMRPDSDIDLGIMPEPGVKISALKRASLAGRLSLELKRTVDVGEISSKNLVYAREALLKSKLVYQKDLDRMNLYRATLLGMYIQFNLDRREVLSEYTAG